MAVIEDVITESIQQDNMFLVPKQKLLKRSVNRYRSKQRPAEPKQKLLKRSVNRYRSKQRPAEPKDLDFMVNAEYLHCEDFLLADIRVNDSRHFVFATPFQLNIMQQAKRWFMDGTFKVVGDPFSRAGQLMSIHAFVRKDGKRKQFPLAFALMSRKRKEDYVKILDAIKQKMERNVLETFVVDFEKGAWQAIREVFSDVDVKGCVFHWTQAVWCHIQELGLVTSYRKREAVHSYIRQLMALPFLPSAHIVETFTVLRAWANNGPLIELTDYMDRQWIRNPIFDVPSWCVFGLTIRTNNDVEATEPMDLESLIRCRT
ncbi:uncharacterized protein LOC121380077 [Gigantopelta aegis]|uniref:uncharacterized protein LOC121380077 n=1 Tax=Gigantopelta aegis TaxID=1735272 RepID=UPI001B887721|nr:uncharacterized protein LOC121380077 [Gigantopelta aegis]XP_041364762.1 uncharacterized protein LOC121380077 [Gigantopelta aegis]